jgi:hypothetical protein
LDTASGGTWRGIEVREMTDNYKWSNPQEWLLEYASKLDANKLFQEFTVLVQQMDSDQIQDLYQSDMDADGYFKPGLD